MTECYHHNRCARFVLVNLIGRGTYAESASGIMEICKSPFGVTCISSCLYSSKSLAQTGFMIELRKAREKELTVFGPRFCTVSNSHV